MVDVKQQVINKVNESYTPKPTKMDVRYSLDHGQFEVLVKQEDEIFFSIWDEDYIKCTAEVEITDKLIKRLNEFIRED